MDSTFYGTGDGINIGSSLTLNSKTKKESGSARRHINRVKELFPLPRPVQPSQEIYVDSQEDIKYSRYLRTVLVESISQEEEVLVNDLCIHMDMGDNVELYHPKLTTAALTYANSELLLRKKHVDIAESVLSNNESMIELLNPEAEEKLNDLTESLIYYTNVLPVVNCNFNQEIDSTALESSVNRLNFSLCNESDGPLTILENVLIKRSSIADDIRKTESVSNSIQKMNNQLTRLASMKISMKEDYTVAIRHSGNGNPSSVSFTGTVITGRNIVENEELSMISQNEKHTI